MFLLTGLWFDIARTDMLAVALSLLGIYFAREKDDFQQLEIVVAGFMFALAFLTKQIALLTAFAAIAYYAIFNWRRAIWLGISFLVCVLILYAAFWINSAGWINYYLFTLPATHIFKISAGRIVSVLVDEFWRVPIFLLLALLPIVIAPRSILSDKLHRFYYVMIASLMASGLVGRLNTFSADNVYIPAYLGLALLVGFEVGWLCKKNPFLQNTLPIMILEWILLSAQFAFLAIPYFQIKMIPSAQDRAAGNALVEKIRSFPGDVVLLDNNYLALYAGKKPYYNDIPMSELSGQGTLYPMPQWRVQQSRIKQLIHAPTTSAIIVGYEGSIKSIIAGCKKQPILYPDGIIFQPVAGPAKSRPNLLITCR